MPAPPCTGIHFVDVAVRLGSTASKSDRPGRTKVAARTKIICNSPIIPVFIPSNCLNRNQRYAQSTSTGTGQLITQQLIDREGRIGNYRHYYGKVKQLAQEVYND